MTPQINVFDPLPLIIVAAVLLIVLAGLVSASIRQMLPLLLVLLLPASALAQVQLMPDAKLRQVMLSLPKVDDPELERIFADQTTIWYTEDEMPKVYQDWTGALPGLHSAYNNVSANGAEPFGNGNHEFPWGKPGGTHASPDVETVKFLWLPKRPDGRPWPVAYYRRGIAIFWFFPVETVIGEVMAMKRPQGYQVVFEIRTRNREPGEWGVEIYRPFPTKDSFEEAIGSEVETRSVTLRLADRSHLMPAFHETAAVAHVPTLSQSQADELLLTAAFKPSSGRFWDWDAGVVAPTTNAGGQIVPKHYLAAFLGNDRRTCINCHQHTAKPVEHFTPAGLRDWYGSIRGSDGIFSFYPFDPRAASTNGSATTNPPMRAAFVRAGIVAPYDPRIHPRDRYTALEVGQ